MKSKNSSRFWLGCVTTRQMRTLPDESSLHELNHRRVIHRSVRNIMFPSEWRHDHIRQTESKLCCETLLSGRIRGIRARVRARQVAVHGSIRQAWLESIRIDGDGADVCCDSEARVGVVIRMAWHRRYVIEWAAAFVIAQEEHRIAPRRARHELADNIRYLGLSGKNRLPISRMFIVVTVAGFDISKAWQGSVCYSL